MELEQIFAKLTPIFQSVFDDDALVVKPETTAAEVEGWDSLSHLRLVLSVQQAFKVKFSASEISGLKNVGELAHLVQAKL
jgi:acyl carrier protein